MEAVGACKGDLASARLGVIALAFDAAVGHLDLEAAHALLRALAAVLVARSPAVPLAPDAVDRAPIPSKICCATCRSARFFFARV